MPQLPWPRGRAGWLPWGLHPYRRWKLIHGACYTDWQPLGLRCLQRDSPRASLETCLRPDWKQSARQHFAVCSAQYPPPKKSLFNSHCAIANYLLPEHFPPFLPKEQQKKKEVEKHVKIFIGRQRVPGAWPLALWRARQAARNPWSHGWAT